MSSLYKIFIFLLSIGAVACNKTPDSRLLQADSLMDSAPKEVLELLKGIDNTTDFSEKEQAIIL